MAKALPSIVGQCIQALHRLLTRGLRIGKVIGIGNKLRTKYADGILMAPDYPGIIAVGEESRVILHDASDQILRSTFADGLCVARSHAATVSLPRPPPLRWRLDDLCAGSED